MVGLGSELRFRLGLDLRAGLYLFLRIEIMFLFIGHFGHYKKLDFYVS